MDFILSADDARLGTRDADGIATFPAVDLFGNVYDALNCNVRSINDRYFVVIPPARDGEVGAVTISTPSKLDHKLKESF